MPVGRVSAGRARFLLCVLLAVVVAVSTAPMSAAAGDRPPSPPDRYDYSSDNRYYASPWYRGAWQEMIPFGCTRAPWYPRDPSCPDSRPGFHHGVDMFMLCGTPVFSAVKGRVVRANVGPAYGAHPLRIRTAWGADFVLGHLRRVLVTPGQRVRPGQLVARSGQSGSPDGCHLHFEKRPAGSGYLSAVSPYRALRRTVVPF